MKDIPELKDDQFWRLIATAGQDFTAFTNALKSMNRDELIGFAWKFEHLAGLLYDEKFHRNQFSEDYLEDLTSWVVAKGKEFYENVLHHADQMPTEVNYSEPSLDIHFQALKEYHDRFGEHMPPFDGG